jgi:D-alanyl-D-alanine carboxypeptidase
MKKVIILLMLTLMSVYSFAGAYVLYDFESSSYILESNKREVRPIASITKLFTAVTVINSGVDLNEKVKVTGRSRGHVPSGVYMTRIDLMRAMLISSDNRAAEALANSHPGGFNQFIIDVNRYLEKNALYNTKIVDASGLLPDNTSTAQDLIEFLSLIKNQKNIREIASERNTAVNAPKGKKTVKIYLRNTNPEIFVYDNILISKTGFTNPAGRCVLMLVEKKNELYGVVVLGQRNVSDRSKIVNELLRVEIPPQPKPVINSTVEFDYSNII